MPGLDEERLEAFALKFLNLCKRNDGEGYLRCNDKSNKTSIVPNKNIRFLVAGLGGDALENLKTLKNNMKEGQ